MKVILFVVILYLVSCSDNTESDTNHQLQKDSTSLQSKNSIDLTYSYAVLGEFFSIKIDSSGAAYSKPNFFKYSKKDTTYLATLNFSQKTKFDSLINEINFTKIDSVYDDHNVDGEDYRIYIGRGAANKFTYIHEREMPKELRRLVQFILDLKNNLNFYHADTVISWIRSDLHLRGSGPSDDRRLRPHGRADG